MSVISECCRLLDFPTIKAGLAIQEASKKLAHTYMFVNGELAYVNEITGDSANIYFSTPSGDTKSLPDSNVQSLDLFLPETGLYVVGSLAFYLFKKSNRQWRKSYCGDFYGVKVLYGSININQVPHKIVNKSPVMIGLVQKDIYYLSKKVASMSGDSLSLYEEAFEREVLEFMGEQGYVTDI